MNLKRIFGGLLTILGIVGLIYGSVMFVNNTNSAHSIKSLVIYCLLGLIFLVSGIGLIRTTKDES